MKFKQNKRKIKILDKHIIRIPADFQLPDIMNSVESFRAANPNAHASPKIYLFIEDVHTNIYSNTHYKILFRQLKDLNQDFGVILPSGLEFPQTISEKDIVVATDQTYSKKPVNKEAQQIQFTKGSAQPVSSLNSNLKTDLEKELDMYKSSIDNIKKHVVPISKSAQGSFQRVFIGMLAFGLLSFFTIAAFAFPTSTITIVPKISSIEQVLNLHLYTQQPDELKDSSSSNILKVYPVKIPSVTTNVKFVSTGTNNIGTNASGRIEITNTAPKPWNLVPFTRFQTEDGLIFRSADFISIPAGTSQKPAIVEVEVTADAYDLAGVGIGERGNLSKDIELSLPGLKLGSQKLISAKTLEDFVGGTTKMEKFVKDTDLVAASEFAQKELKVKLSNLLSESIQDLNLKDNSDLELLNSPETMQVTNIKLSMDNNLVGKPLNSFQVQVSATLEGFAYSHKDLENILRNKLISNLDPHNNLKSVDFKNLSYKIFKTNPETQTFDATFVISGLQQAQLTGAAIDVQRIYSDIKDSVASQELDTALQTLKSNRLVETASIKSFPFWKSSVSSNKNNIKLLVNESIPN